MQEHLTYEDFFSELKNRSGLIPVDIDSENEKVKWTDFETYHFYEGFFHKSLNSFAELKSLQAKTPTTLTTNLDVLREKKIINDSIYPTGFIFHTGRCGSTLLAKVLARSRNNLVISEANPLSQIFLLDSDFEDRKTLYKNLIFAMGRKRVSTHKNYYVKFTSFNILFFDFIKNLFPDVPSIFIYRDPMRVLSSFFRNPPGWLQMNDNTISRLTGISSEEISGSNSLELKAKILTKFFQSALNAKGVSYLNYNKLEASNLPTILQTFNADYSNEDFVIMKSQFNYDSKAEGNTKIFHPAHNDINELLILDVLTKNHLFNLYEQLAESVSNITSLDKGNDKQDSK